MARITVNTTGTQPCLVLTSNVSVNGVPTFDSNVDLYVTCLQDITVTNSTGVYSYTDFCSDATKKLATPADNSISATVVIDDQVWFGNGAAYSANAAITIGVQKLANDKELVGFRVFWADKTGTTAGAKYRQGVGYVTSLAPTVTPEAPVWISPIEIAVDGSFTDGNI